MTGGAPLVSVVIPCHNYGRYLAEAIESALAQTYPAVEVLVVDDGSDDDTSAVAHRYSPRVGYVHQRRGGLSSARNAGAASCRGDFIAYLDADDRLDPRYVDACVDAFDGDPAVGFVYTQARHFGAVDLVTHHPDFDTHELSRGNYIHATAVIRTDLVRRFGYDRSLTVWEDWNFYLTLAERGIRGRLVDEPLLWYRRHDESMTAHLDPLGKKKAHWAVYRRHPRLYPVRFLYRYRVNLAKASVKTRYRRWRSAS